MFSTCKNCGKRYEKYDKPHISNSNKKLKRGYRTVTCSSKCSREYQSKAWKRKKDGK